jgi:hypothetical protein
VDHPIGSRLGHERNEEPRSDVMPLLNRLREFLEMNKVPYSVHSHPHAYTAQEIAGAGAGIVARCHPDHPRAGRVSLATVFVAGRGYAIWRPGMGHGATFGLALGLPALEPQRATSRPPLAQQERVVDPEQLDGLDLLKHVTTEADERLPLGDPDVARPPARLASLRSEDDIEQEAPARPEPRVHVLEGLALSLVIQMKEDRDGVAEVEVFHGRH